LGQVVNEEIKGKVMATKGKRQRGNKLSEYVNLKVKPRKRTNWDMFTLHTGNELTESMKKRKR